MTASTRNYNKRRPKQFWEQHIRQWEESSIKQTEYCRINGISIKSFTYWKCKLKKTPDTPTFFPITLRTSPVAKTIINHEALKLNYGDKYQIEIGDDFSPNTLVKLIRTLEGL